MKDEIEQDMNYDMMIELKERRKKSLKMRNEKKPKHLPKVKVVKNETFDFRRIDLSNFDEDDYM